jgi:hypothetical protein
MRPAYCSKRIARLTVSPGQVRTVSFHPSSWAPSGPLVRETTWNDVAWT